MPNYLFLGRQKCWTDSVSTNNAPFSVWVRGCVCLCVCVCVSACGACKWSYPAVICGCRCAVSQWTHCPLHRSSRGRARPIVKQDAYVRVVVPCTHLVVVFLHWSQLPGNWLKFNWIATRDAYFKMPRTLITLRVLLVPVWATFSYFRESA